MRTQKLKILASCFAGMSALMFVGCTEEAPKRPQSTGTNPGGANADDLRAAQERIKELEEAKDSSSEENEKPKNTNQNPQTGDNPSSDPQEEVVGPKTPDTPVNNTVGGGGGITGGSITDDLIGLNPSNGNQQTTGSAIEGAAAWAGNKTDSSTSGQQTLKAKQSTILTSATDGSKTCYVAANKSFTASDVVRLNGSVTFKLLTIDGCDNLKNQSVVGVDSHIQ